MLVTSRGPPAAGPDPVADSLADVDPSGAASAVPGSVSTVLDPVPPPHVGDPPAVGSGPPVADSLADVGSPGAASTEPGSVPSVPDPAPPSQVSSLDDRDNQMDELSSQSQSILCDLPPTLVLPLVCLPSPAALGVLVVALTRGPLPLSLRLRWATLLVSGNVQRLAFLPQMTVSQPSIGHVARSLPSLVALVHTCPVVSLLRRLLLSLVVIARFPLHGLNVSLQVFARSVLCPNSKLLLPCLFG